jgi:hypothetical protein
LHLLDEGALACEFRDGIAIAESQQVSSRDRTDWKLAMQIRNRRLSESRNAFPAPRNNYRKRESSGFVEPLLFPASNECADERAPDTIVGFQNTGRDHPEVRFNEEEGLVLFDRSAEHHLFIPFLDMLLRQYQERPESRATVREWVSVRKSCSPLGFDALCEYLDLDAEYVRDGLTRWLNKVDRGLDDGAGESRFFSV